MPAELTGPRQPLGEQDAARLKSLRRMKAAALGLLVLAAVIYALTIGSDGWLGFVNAAAEASMVGAVADWFAVTALFRRPLGLPIPHTALIPERKAQLGRSLDSFVRDNFLTGAVVRQRVLTGEPTLLAAKWIADPDQAERLVRRLAPLIARGLDSLDETEISAIVEQAVLPRIAAERLSPAAGQVLERVLEDSAHKPLLDLALSETMRWLRANEETVASLVNERAPDWAPVWLEGIVARRFYRELLGWLADIQAQPAHRARLAVDSLLTRLADDLQNDPQTQAEADAFKHRILASPAAAAAATSLSVSARDAVTEGLRAQDGPVQDRMAVLLVESGKRLLQDAELRQSLDQRFSDAAVSIAENYGSEITATISQTIEQWDGKEAANKLELVVGRDLQFIRINGTVIGALAGLVIHAFSVAF